MLTYCRCRSEKVVNIRPTYYECVFGALGTQNAMHERHIFICGLSYSAIFFYVISQRARFSEKIKLLKVKMCVLNYSTTFVWNISYFEKNSAWCYHKCKLVFMSSTRYSLSGVNETWIFLTGFSKNTQIKFLWKTVQLERSCSVRTDRHDEVNSVLRNFANAPTNGIICQVV